MADRKTADVDRLLAERLSGPEKIQALLTAGGCTYRDFARKYSLFPPDVTSTVKGRRRNEDVCQAIAEELGIEIDALDALLAETAAAG